MAEQPGAAAPRAPAPLEAVLADAEPALLRLAERLCSSRADARDLLQDTFERVLRQGLPAEVRNPRAWLITSLHHLFIDRCRSSARRPSHEPIADHPDVTQLEPDGPEPGWSRITVDDIRDALEAIEPVYREVYRLHTFEHLSYEDIAGRLAIQRVTVGTRLNRARKKLREVLVARFGLEEAP